MWWRRAVLPSLPWELGLSVFFRKGGTNRSPLFPFAFFAVCALILSLALRWVLSLAMRIGNGPARCTHCNLAWHVAGQPCLLVLVVARGELHRTPPNKKKFPAGSTDRRGTGSGSETLRLACRSVSCLLHRFRLMRLRRQRRQRLHGLPCPWQGRDAGRRLYRADAGRRQKASAPSALEQRLLHLTGGNTVHHGCEKGN